MNARFAPPERVELVAVAAPVPPASAARRPRAAQRRQPELVKNRWEEKTKAERGVAHIIRRQRPGQTGKPAPPRKPDPVTRPADPLEETGATREGMATPVKRPKLRAPAGKEQRPAGDATGTLDELTVEDAARPLPPLSLVREAEAAQRQSAASVAQLVIAEGNDRGRSHPLIAERTTVGRGVDNDIVLTDISVSRHHLVIEFDGAAHWIRDLGSGNGTLINDREHDGRTRLCQGDHLELGNTVIRYELADAVDSAVSTGNWRRRPSDHDEMSTVEGRRDRGPARVAARPTAPPTRRPPAPAPRPAAPRMPPLQAPAHFEEDRPLPDRDRAADAAIAAVRAVEAPGPSPFAAVPSPPPSVVPSPLPAGVPVPAPPPPGPAMAPPGPSIPYPSLPAQLPQMYPTPSYGGLPGVPPSGSLPSMQSPPAPARSAERRKLWIGGAALALLLVGIGAVAALTAGGSEGEGRALAAAPSEPTAEAEPAAAPAAEKAEAEPAAAEAVPANEAASAEPEATPIATLASLRTGGRELPATAWGTEEGFVAELPEAPAQGDDSAEAEPEPEDQGTTDEAEDQARREREAAARREREAAARAEHTRAAQRQEEEAERQRRERQRAEREPKRREPAVERDEPSVDTRAVKAEALALYKQQQFTGAADALRAAADELSGKRAAELRSLAAGYGQVGNLLASAERSQRSDAPAALRAYKRALQRDEQISGGAHSTLIRLRIGQVAPRAARAHMTKKRYADARRAADDAARYGSADDVAAVLGSLERRAERDLRTALERLDRGDEDSARDLLEDIVRYAPSSSSVRDRAADELESL